MAMATYRETLFSDNAYVSLSVPFQVISYHYVKKL